MKKSMLLLSVLLSCSLFSSAQDLSHKVIVGGVLDFSSGNDDTETSTRKFTRFGVQPMVGYYLSPKVVVGIAGSYLYHKYETNYELSTTIDSENKTNTYLFGPFARYHFNLGEKFSFFLHLEALYGKENGKSTHISDDIKDVYELDGNLFQTLLEPGIIYRVTDKIFLEAQFLRIYYAYAKTEETSEGREPTTEKSSSFGASLNRIGFGLAVLF